MLSQAVLRQWGPPPVRVGSEVLGMVGKKLDAPREQPSWVCLLAGCLSSTPKQPAIHAGLLPTCVMLGFGWLSTAGGCPQGTGIPFACACLPAYC